jgi:hypothetical protein
MKAKNSRGARKRPTHSGKRASRRRRAKTVSRSDDLSSAESSAKNKFELVRSPPQPEEIIEVLNARSDIRTRSILAIVLVLAAVIAMPIVAVRAGRDSTMLAWGIIGPVLSSILTYYFLCREKQKPKINSSFAPAQSSRADDR